MTTVRSEDREGGVRILNLDRPPANAIDETLLADLDVALDAAGADDAVRAVVLRGAGAFFCGGFDFAAPRRDDAAAPELYTRYRETHRKLLTLPKPTVAMVNGHAIAGGLVLVLACDYRLGLDGEYRVGLNEVAVGAAFPRTAFEIVRLRLAHARASELILGAALYPASQAVRLGIVDEVFPADRFEDTVFRRAARLAAFPREAYAHAKAALVADAAQRIDAETPDEAMQTMAVWLAPESRAARARQREKLGVRR
jgi:enoyl-CoA hydratase/carnithine racemase